MPNVSATNTTSSSITVAGHKTYYIDSADAEIVEVEGQGGGGSTASDDATGTISGVTLPTAHSYTGVSFDSLRYYVKGTISNTGQTSYAFGLWDTFFYGTITWEDSSLGDLTDKIATNSPSNNYRAKQTVFRIIFITYDSISGYHPWDDGDASTATNNNQISDYSYNNGVHSITFWADGVNWIGGSIYLGRIQFRYLDGVTTFNNLSAFDLVNVSGGSLSKATTTDRYGMYNVWNGDVTLHALYGSGQALPSVGDTVTFGNYPQATSTPEPIEWTVLAVDSVNGKALLIAKKVLDCQNFNSGNTNTTWETCSLRTWLNNTFLETAFNSTERGRILTTHIETPNNPSYPSISGGNATDDKVFLLSIQEADDTSYFENAAARKTLATQIAISNGIYEESGYAYWMLRSLGADGKSVADVLPDGGLSYSGLSTYSAPGNGIRPAFWFGLPPAIRRNAFKYTLSGTPYWYVIDGEHDTWTDDLSAWGYSEVQPAPVLPEVSALNNLGVTTSGSDTPQTVASGGTSYNLKYWSGGGWYGSYEPFDSTKCYAIVKYGKESGVWLSPCGVFEPVDVSGNISAKNVSQTSQVFRSAQIAVCSSNQATVVPVYDSSNVAYNAFKFTANNTDYYYVLDGTQTDWTDDLAGIGYSLTPIPLKGYVSSSLANTLVTRYAERFLFDASGNYISYDSSKTYTIVGLYLANGGAVSASYSNSYISVGTSNRLKLYWNDSDAYMAYVEYTVS